MAYAVAKRPIQKAKIISNIDQQFYTDVVTGLSSTPKSLSPKYFYDEAGSRYFDEICQLPEYYPYKTELSLLPQVANDLAEVLTGDYAVVEFGAGSLQKIKPFFDNIKGIKSFFPIDISGDYLRSTTLGLQAEYPKITMRAIEGDFTQSVKLPETQHQKLGFFPGSTIGNFTPEQAVSFLRNAKITLRENAHLIIGVDTKKSPAILHRAYNDSLGVTKAFNLNILARINRELAGDFNINAFDHYAFYNPVKGCIEMHLVSNSQQTVKIGNEIFSFAAGETIHTESSYKYTPDEFKQLAESAGWQVKQQWLADNAMFSTFLLKA